MNGFTDEWRGVVFDLDGTLIHSVPSLRLALNDVLAEDGHEGLSDDEVRSMVGEGANLLVARAYAARGVSSRDENDDAHARRLERFLERYGSDPLDGTTTYPGALDLLSLLSRSGVTCGVCTNKPEAPSRVLLAALGLSPFINAVVGGDTLPERKPDPAPLIRTLELLGVKPQEALYVGDSAIDVACARAVGLPVVILAHGYATTPAMSLGADAVFDDFAGLQGWLSSFLKW